MKQLFKKNYVAKTFKPFDGDITIDTVQFYINRNFFSFFDKEKIGTLEKLNTLDIAEIVKTIPTNSKQH